MKRFIAVLMVIIFFSSCSITFLPQSPEGYHRYGYRNYRYWNDEYRFHNQIPNNRVIIVPHKNFDNKLKPNNNGKKKSRTKTYEK